METVFRAKKIHREALAAILLFCEAARQEWPRWSWPDAPSRTSRRRGVQLPRPNERPRKELRLAAAVRVDAATSFGLDRRRARRAGLAAAVRVDVATVLGLGGRRARRAGLALAVRIDVAAVLVPSDPQEAPEVIQNFDGRQRNGFGRATRGGGRRRGYNGGQNEQEDGGGAAERG